MSLLKRIAALTLPLAVASCGGQSGETPSGLKDTVDASLGSALLGYGYDSHTETFTSRCAEANATPDVLYTGAQQSEIRFDNSLSYEELKSVLDVAVSGKLNLPTFDVKAAARFLAESASTELSRALVFSSRVHGKSALLNQPKLTAGAQSIAATHDRERIRAQCGDRFVEQVDLGAELFVTTKFEFASQEVKSQFEAQIDLNFVKLFEVSGSAKVAFERFGDSVMVSMIAHQIGGNVGQLAHVLGADAQGQIPILRCSLKNSEQCLQALENVVRYANSSFPQQVQNLSYNPADPNGAAFLSYRVKDYYAAGLSALYPTPGPILEQEIVEARNRLLTLYEIQRKHRKRSTALLAMRLSAAERQVVNSTDQVLSRNIDKIVRVAQTCYERPGECVPAESALQLEIYDPNVLVKTLVFYDYCIIPQKTAEIKATTEAIRKYFHAPADVDCEDLEADLNAYQVIDLNGNALSDGDKISDLRPLRNLPNLLELDLSGNKIRNASVIGTLPKLRALNLRKNLVSSVQPLGGLKELRTLDLAYNRVIDVEPLAGLTNLRVLKLHGGENNVVDPAPVQALPRIETLYLSNDQICQTERDWAKSAGQVSVGEYQFYKEVNWAPVYNTALDRSSGISGWFACPAVASQY